MLVLQIALGTAIGIIFVIGLLYLYEN